MIRATTAICTTTSNILNKSSRQSSTGILSLLRRCNINTTISRGNGICSSTNFSSIKIVRDRANDVISPYHLLLNEHTNDNRWNANATTAIAASLATLLVAGWTSSSQLEAAIEEEEEKELPVYRMSEVEKRNGSEDGGRIWMSYAGNVYDGGSEKIMQAAGSNIEPYWNIYRQHFSTDVPSKVLESLLIGTLDLNDQERIDDAMEISMNDENDPYRNEPIDNRSQKLKMHSDYPANAEVPSQHLTEKYITPNEMFYIRNHHPVPFLSPEDVEQYYSLIIDLTALKEIRDSHRSGVIHLSLTDLKSLPKFDVVATLQCSGNRRSHFNRDVKVTSGTPWAKWTGPRLRDVLKLAGLEADHAEALGLDHLRLEGLDGMKASIHLSKAINPYGDCIIAYEMNGEPLTPDHGYPVRLIVPGYAAVRNVKWLSKIQVSEAEAEGPWQRGLNYKITPPGVTDITGMDLAQMPSLNEVSIFSGITNLHKSKILDKNEAVPPSKPGDIIKVTASGWAWAGGGRNIARVDLSGDNGTSWTPATITQGKNQKYSRAWAWVFWQQDDIPAVVLEDGTVQLCSKAVDASLNSQPEDCFHMWNVRGLGNNSWFRVRMKVD